MDGPTLFDVPEDDDDAIADARRRHPSTMSAPYQRRVRDAADQLRRLTDGERRSQLAARARRRSRARFDHPSEEIRSEQRARRDVLRLVAG